MTMQICRSRCQRKMGRLCSRAIQGQNARRGEGEHSTRDNRTLGSSIIPRSSFPSAHDIGVGQRGAVAGDAIVRPQLRAATQCLRHYPTTTAVPALGFLGNCSSRSRRKN